MIARFRMVAGPNGSGKTTLMRRLAADYAVNFYEIINADDIFAEVSRSGRYAPRMSMPDGILRSYAAATSYPEDVRRFFADGMVALEGDRVRFAPDAVNSYTVALLADFLQEMYIAGGASFSRETVFSHPSKVAALAAARKAGFRTYLYFVATESAEVNVARVANRVALGGHSVPREKIESRFADSVANAAAALPHLSRAFFFDNSGETMRFFAEWGEDSGLTRPAGAEGCEPVWFAPVAEAAARLPVAGGAPSADGPAIAAAAEVAGREAAEQALAAGLPVTLVRGGRVVTVSPDGATGEKKGVPR